MSRQVQGVFLAIVGAVMLRVALSGEYLNYVKPSLQPYLIAAALIVVALGVAGLLRDLRPRVGHDAADPAAEHGHGSRAGWLFGVPVAVLLLVPPPALGSYAANRLGASVPRPESTSFAPLAPAPVVSLGVREYAERATWGRGSTLAGRTVRLAGFVTPHADGWYLTRLSLNCCAADARGSQVDIVGVANDQPAEAWVEVTGRWEASAVGDPAAAVPRLRAAQVVDIERPRNPYE